MKTALIAACALALLAGCATPATDAERAAAHEPLLCRGAEQCRDYWARAQTWIAQNSAWSIAAASDSVISTAQPEEHSPLLGYSATRTPAGDGAERINLQIRCRNIYGCKQSPEVMAARFKAAVRGN